MIRNLLVRSAASACSAAVASVAVAAPNNVVVQYEGTELACAGIGYQSQSNPRWDQFPLKMVFTNVDGDYLGDVSVSVRNSNGEVVAAADCGAPWFLAMLPDGRYTAEVAAHDRYTKAVDFSVSGDGQTQVFVPFPRITGT